MARVIGNAGNDGAGTTIYIIVAAVRPLDGCHGWTAYDGQSLILPEVASAASQQKDQGKASGIMHLGVLASRCLHQKPTGNAYHLDLLPESIVMDP